MSRTIIIDIETDRLINPSVIWMAVCKEVGKDGEEIFIRPDLSDRLEKYLASADVLVGHNIISFDLPILVRLCCRAGLPEQRIRDTLILSRMCHYAIDGGHSLKAWGVRLKSPKGEFDEFNKMSNEMLQYCIQDVRLTEKLYLFLLEKYIRPRHEVAIDMEHKFASICDDIHKNGFGFNFDKASELYQELWGSHLVVNS